MRFTKCQWVHLDAAILPSLHHLNLVLWHLLFVLLTWGLIFHIGGLPRLHLSLPLLRNGHQFLGTFNLHRASSHLLRLLYQLLCSIQFFPSSYIPQPHSIVQRGKPLPGWIQLLQSVPNLYKISYWWGLILTTVYCSRSLYGTGWWGSSGSREPIRHSRLLCQMELSDSGG